MKKSVEERFMSKVRKEDNGCWLWTAYIMHKGYGQFGVRGKLQRAHRVAYEMFVGPIPEGLYVCHVCDVPACVNPAHLYVGTSRDNKADSMAKGRHRVPGLRGEQNGRAKLMENQVVEIRRRYAEMQSTQEQLAAEFGVSRETVKDIVKRRIWAHVP